MQTYTVGHGDSVSKISKILYGDFSRTQEICKLNNLVDCNLVQPGQVLKVPDPTNVKDAEVLPLTADGSGWKKTVGKWFPWVVVGVAAYILTKEGHKAHKKKKAAKSKPLSGLSGKKNKLSKHDAKQMAIDAGIDFKSDFHTLSSSKVETLVELAKKSGYQKSKTSPGSRGRAFLEHLQKVK